MVHVTAETGDSHGNGASADPPPDDDGGRRDGLRAGQEPGPGGGAPGRAGVRGASRLPAAPPPPAPSADDAAGELERLASLHDSGALSDDEFAAAKQKVLGV